MARSCMIVVGKTNEKERKNGSMLKAQMILKMISNNQSGKHDIAHFLKVYAYASTIGKLEGLDPETQQIVELAAIVHDISCPFCRERYGNCSGKNQEKESEGLLRPFLAEFELSNKVRERIIELVSHHHTYEGVDGLDWQILLEADYLVNADEGGADVHAIRSFEEKVFRTNSGKKMLHDLYLSK